MIYFISNRNYRQTCQQLSGLDLTAWESNEEPEYSTEAIDTDEDEVPSIEEISESMIKAAVEKAKIDLNERNKFEYMSWLNRKLFQEDFKPKMISFFEFFINIFSKVEELMQEHQTEQLLHLVKLIEMP